MISFNLSFKILAPFSIFFAANIALTTAAPAMPEPLSSPAFSWEMPPMAMTGMETA